MNRRLIVLLCCGYLPQIKAEEPNFELEEIQKTLTQKDKAVSDLELINKDVISPKEYGLKKLRTKKYRYDA